MGLFITRLQANTIK